MVCGGLWWFVVDCGGLSFSHTGCHSDSVSHSVCHRPSPCVPLSVTQPVSLSLIHCGNDSDIEVWSIFRRDQQHLAYI